MAFELYEFDEGWLPNDFEEIVRELSSFCLGFYIREKYLVDENDWCFENERDPESVVVYCPTLNDVFDIDPKVVESEGCGCSHGYYSYKDPVCPHEGSCASTCYLKNAVYKHNGLKREYHFGFIQQTNLGVVIRAFRCEFDFSGERYELRREGEFKPREFLRVFFNKDRTTEIYSRLNKGYSQYGGYFRFVGNNWIKKKKYQDNADFVLIDDFKGTLLEGFEKYIELAESFSTDNERSVILLLAMFKFPVLKHLIKAGFNKIVDQITASFIDNSTVRGKLPFNYKAKNVKQFFEFEVSKLNSIDAELKAELSIHDLKNLREMNRLEIKFTNDNFIMCTSPSFENLMLAVGDERIKEVLKYLRTQTDIEISNRVGDYYDYLLQTLELNLNLADKQVRYPKNLSRAHGRLSTMVGYGTTPELREGFRKQAERYEKYCFRQGDLSLRAVRTAKELKVWGQRFSNCSGGYVDRIAQGNTMIFVIVNRHNASKPYVMLEYNPMTSSIVQCRGYCNKEMGNDIVVKDFCNKWRSFIKGKKPEAI